MKKTQKGETSSWRLDHVGVLVRDLDKAVDSFQSLNIGPFGPNESKMITDRKVYGKPANIKLKGMFAPMGPVRLELIQPIEGESVQKEILDSKGEGINHIAFTVDDLDKEVKKLEEQGFKVVSSGKMAPSYAFAYIDTRKIGGFIIELIKEK